MNVRIDRCRDLDYQTVAALDYMDAQCLPGDEPESKVGEWWIGRNEEGLPVCFAGGKLYGDWFYFTRAGVLKPYRGLRLHRRLIQARINYARKEGLIGAFTYTSDWNHASANNLIRAGFTQSKKLYRPGCIHWVRRFQDG